MQMRRRPAARLLVIDPRGRILLFRFDHRKGALAGTTYWATPGGGLEAGESFEQAAIRELQEETGIHIADIGPVIARREIVFQLSNGEYVLEEECYFQVSVPTDHVSLGLWSADELECMTEFHWWTEEELETASATISPDNLLALLRSRAA